MTNKELYPLKFIPLPTKTVWGGSELVTRFSKELVEINDEGEERTLTAEDRVGESWEVADMGYQDSVVKEGWLAGNTLGELMETYLDRIVGENVYNYFGRQFPLLIKFLDIQDRISVQVHPDDEVAAQRYDQLGKAEIWYIVDAKPGAKAYVGFKKDMTAQELYDRCNDGTIEEVLNVIHPKKGDAIHIPPGTVHAAGGGLLIAEVQESSDLTFRLYDWGREFDPATRRQMHLEEAIDFIDYRKFDESLYIKDDKEEMVQTIVETGRFNVTRLNLTDPLHIYTEKFESFIIYMCVNGEASIQVASEDGKSQIYRFKAGETILVPAEMKDFILAPIDISTKILEVVTRPEVEEDEYEDYDLDIDYGHELEHGHDCGCGHHHHE